MRLDELPSHDELLAQDFAHDAAARARYDELELSRALAHRVLAHRAQMGLSQSALGKLLGMKQPQVARLEAAEHVPTFATLRRVAQALQIEIALDFRPAGRAPELVDAAPGGAVVAQSDTLVVAIA